MLAGLMATGGTLGALLLPDPVPAGLALRCRTHRPQRHLRRAE